MDKNLFFNDKSSNVRWGDNNKVIYGEFSNSDLSFIKKELKNAPIDFYDFRHPHNMNTAIILNFPKKTNMVEVENLIKSTINVNQKILDKDLVYPSNYKPKGVSIGFTLYVPTNS